jgi:predicted PurR-regulated permease PerM
VFALAGVVLLWYLFDVLLLVFAAVLLAVIMHRPAAWLAQRSRLSSPWALGVVLLCAALAVGAAGWLLGSAVKEQSQALVEQVPQVLDEARDRLEAYGWLSERLDSDEVLSDGGSAFLGRGLRVVSATFGAMTNLALVIFMAVLFAAQPDLYRRGVLRLIPLHRRKRIGELLDCMEDTLRRWLLGQLCLMAFVGACSTLGLWLLGVDYALALGLLAGLLTFIPFIGPLLAAAVAILISLADGLIAALWVGLLYLATQIAEGLLEPVVQQRTVYLAPVLLLVAQLALGVLVGVIGVVLATPLAAVTMVAVRMLYVQDTLGDHD